MTQRRLLPGRWPEPEFLGQVGFWFVTSGEAKAHTPRIRKFLAKGLIGMRRHRRTDGGIVDAYELTDAGLERLASLTDAAAAQKARIQRDYLRKQAQQHRTL